MIGISLDIPEVAVRGGGLSWLPRIGGVAPLFFADFTTEGGTNRYWYNGVQYAGFSAWNTAAGGTYSRASTATYLQGGVVKTALSGAARFPTDGTGNALGIRLTGAQTELCIQNRDLTQAAWTATTMTVAKDQTGADGTAAAASSLLATAGNATVLQSITSGSATRLTGAYVKRLVGTGEIDITQDNGATWTPITITGSYTFYTIPTATVTNPVIGFRIVTNGDKIAVDYVSQRVASFISDVIATTTVTVTQVTDSLILPAAFSGSAGTAILGTNDQQNSGIFFAQGDTLASWAALFPSSNTQVETLNGARVIAANTGAGTWASARKSGSAGNASGSAIVLNGGTVVTDVNPYFASPTPTSVQVGARNAGSFSYGNVSMAGLWNNTVASSADLQRLTT